MMRTQTLDGNSPQIPEMTEPGDIISKKSSQSCSQLFPSLHTVATDILGFRMKHRQSDNHGILL